MNQILSVTPKQDRGAALDRQRISDNYHTRAYPSFGYSTGPFRVYDHSVAKGSVKAHNRCKSIAQAKYDQDIE